MSSVPEPAGASDPFLGRDAYVRIGARPSRVFGAADSSDSLIFVDVAPGAQLKEFHRASVGAYRHPAAILVRESEQASETDLQQLKDSLKLGTRTAYGLLIQRPGEPLRVAGGEIDPMHVDDFVMRARAGELRALLEWGHAAWTSDTFHFELPSGLHSDVFVRVADAIREPHDAAVLASWFAPVMEDRLGIVIDSGTMSALVEAIHARMAAAGMTPGPVAVLDQYPRTNLDTVAAVVHANEVGAVLGIVSINSSGRLRDRLWAAMGTQAALLDRPSLHVLVDTGAPPGVEGITAWLPRSGEAPLATPSIEASRCGLCEQPERALVVPITPASLRLVLPSQRTLLMPSVDDPDLNRSFWEVCDRTQAIGVEENPRIKPLRFRPRGRMNVLFGFEELLDGTDFLDLVRHRLSSTPLAERANLVLTAEGEMALPGFDAFWSGIADLLTDGDVVTFPIEHPFDDPALIEAVESAGRILIFALGSVSGSSLQRGLIGVQRLRDDWMFSLDALVLHARPTQWREWESLRNSFAGRLRALWLTYFPDRSPLAEEAEVLSGLKWEQLTEEQREFREQRLRFCNGVLGTYSVPLFWGARLEDHLTPHSLFGKALRSPAVYAAVGAALERRRVRAEAKRALLPVFEMPALVRSYYDPLILGAVFRWLRPHEAYWGSRPDSGEKVVGELLARAHDTSDDHLRVLLCELGLALAQGKLGAGGDAVAITEIRRRLEEAETGQAERVALETALILAGANLQLGDGAGVAA